MSDLFLSVIIPAYNEADRLGSSLQSICGYLLSRGVRFEIIVVDDASQDETYRVAEELNCRDDDAWRLRLFRNERNRGKGYSVRRGMLECEGRYALLTDADLSTPIQEFEKLENYVLHAVAQIAFGSRDVQGSQVEVHQSAFRERSGKFFNWLVRHLTGLPYRDTQCGFKLFEMKQCKAIFARQRIEDFGFDVEVLYVAQKWGLSLKEVPVVWRHVSGSKVNFVPDAARMILDLLRVRWNDWIGRYD
ncbi:MAG: dolichyl-phosphate beta-glucosyltransferase [Acidobacteriota bacterium]